MGKSVCTKELSDFHEERFHSLCRRSMLSFTATASHGQAVHARSCTRVDRCCTAFQVPLIVVFRTSEQTIYQKSTYTGRLVSARLTTVSLFRTGVLSATWQMHWPAKHCISRMNQKGLMC